MERPFRIFIAKGDDANTYERWRCYGYLGHAQIAAWILSKQKKIGTVLVVQHIESAKTFGEYVRHVDNVSFHKERKDYEQPGERKRSASKRGSTKRAKRKEKIDRETGEIQQGA